MTNQAAPSEWTSLEIVKLLVAFLTPVFLFVLGVMVTRAARRVESAQWASRKLIERRLELHQKLAPLLNDLLCFFTWRGHFREIAPPRAIAIKRELDKTVYANQQLFSEEFAAHYKAFLQLLFYHWRGVGKDAELRVSKTKLRAERGEDTKWEPEWDRLFVAESQASDPVSVVHAYERLMDHFADELGVRGSANVK